mgnify:CR=1 FL=1
MYQFRDRKESRHLAQTITVTMISLGSAVQTKGPGHLVCANDAGSGVDHGVNAATMISRRRLSAAEVEIPERMP